MPEPTPLQKHYQSELAKERRERQEQYQRRLEQFADDSIKTFRELTKNPDPKVWKELIEAIELDWADLQEIKRAL